MGMKIAMGLVLWISHFAMAWSSESLMEIGFDKAAWVCDEGAVIKGDQLHITGEDGEYIKVQLNVPAEMFHTQALYFMADLQFVDLKFGEKRFERPKMKIYNESQNKYYGENIHKYAKNIVNVEEELSFPELYSVRWKLPKGDKSNMVTLEIAMQSTEGLMVASNPRLSTKLPVIEYAYDTFPYALEKSDMRSVLKINTKDSKPFNQKILGVNSPMRESDIVKSYADPRVIEVVSKVSPSFMRFPGGTTGNWYDWRTDRWKIPDPENFMKGGEGYPYPRHQANGWILHPTLKGEARPFRYPDFLKLYKAQKFNVTLMFNILYESPEESVERLKHRLKSGLKIDWIELGNEQELYNQIGFGDVHTAEQYIEKCERTMKALKAVDPSIKIAINACGDGGHFDQVVAKKRFYDGVVVHLYTGTRKEASVKMLDMFRLDENLRVRLNQCQDLFPGKPLLVTEYGVAEPRYQKPKTFLSSIMELELVMRFVEYWDKGIVDGACIHLLGTDHALSQMNLFGFHPVAQKTQTGYLFEILWRELRGADYLSSSLEGTYIRSTQTPLVNAMTYRNNKGELCILMNNKSPLPGSLELVVDGQSVKGKKYQQQVWREDCDLNKKDHILYGIDDEPMMFGVEKQGTLTLKPNLEWNISTGSVIVPPQSISVVKIPEA